MRFGMAYRVAVSWWAALLGASTAVAQSDGTPASHPAASAPVFRSYQQLRRHFADRQRELSRQLLRERLAALETFFAGARGEDLESAFRDFVSAAIEAGEHARAVEVAERYAKEFASSSGAANVAAMRITALSEQGRFDAALAAWASLANGAASEDWGPVCDAGIRLGDMLALAGRTAEARKQYEEVNRRMGRYPNVGVFLGRRLAALGWVGREAPAIDGNDLTGKAAKLEEYRGRIVLLDFWSTSCGPCLRELPGLIRAYDEHHGEGFEVIGICLDPGVSTLHAFLKQNKVPWRQICDGQSWQGPNAMRYSVRAVPSLFLIGRDGRIAFMPLSADDLEYALSRLLRKGAGLSEGR
ncbi:MAG: redoxin domain-containing protein [Phycisphaerae bacterium]